MFSVSDVGDYSERDYEYIPEDEYHCIHQLDEQLFQGSWSATQIKVLDHHNIAAIVNGDASLRLVVNFHKLTF
jgi:hypothetical protein